VGEGPHPAVSPPPKLPFAPMSSPGSRVGPSHPGGGPNRPPPTPGLLTVDGEDDGGLGAGLEVGVFGQAGVGARLGAGDGGDDVGLAGVDLGTIVEPDVAAGGVGGSQAAQHHVLPLARREAPLGGGVGLHADGRLVGAVCGDTGTFSHLDVPAEGTQPSQGCSPTGGKPACEASLERVHHGGCVCAMVHGGHGGTLGHGGHASTMAAMVAWRVVAMDLPWVMVAAEALRWPWRYRGSKVRGGHGHTLVAWHTVAMDVSWWQHACWPWPHRGGHGGVTVGWCMVAMDMPWWLWRQHGGRVYCGHGCIMVATCLLAMTIP